MHRFRTIPSVVRRFAVLALTDTRTKILRRAVWGVAGLICLAFLVLLLALRYRILPNIENYRETIERQVGAKIGRDVTIGRINADWDGINPYIVLRNLSVLDNDKRPVLSIPRIEAVLSWRSLVAPTLNLLRVEDVRLNLARDASGRFWVAGLSFDPSGGETTDTALTDWLFAQRRIQIHHASLVWEDALRRAPRLEITDIDLTLDNDWKRHRFSLAARLPRAIGSDVDLRGELVGKHWERPTGQAYIDIDRADLAAWKPWVDYPADLSKGQGRLRARIDFSKGRIDLLTADFALNDVRVRLKKALPLLDLDSASGRIRVRMPRTGFEVEGSQVELAARPSGALEAVRIAPTDFRVEWENSREGKARGARIEAGRVDFSALANLSKYLPLDAATREGIRTYAPQGAVSGLEARWQGEAFPFQSYLLKANFERFGMNAVGSFPKLSGLTGALFANERGGTLALRSERAAVELRRIFPETRIALDKLDADASWRIQNGALEVNLSNADFSGTDAAGAARGSYRYTGGGAGYIDMTGELTRADAKAVWRYIPSVVGIGARHWLRDALLSGGSDDAKLTLKGNLDDFPFKDPQKGLFLVTVKARDVTLNYGKAWPKITGIDGDLRFEKSEMHVAAKSGRILGAQIGGGGDGIDAFIPDFDAPTCELILKGGVRGPTSEFLKFIEKSPVAQRIGGVTREMRASGNGALALMLNIPLDEAQLADSRISGTYRFQNNALFLDTEFPPLQKASGTLHFSGTDLRLEEVGAAFLGGTLKIGGGKQADGNVRITFDGTANLSKSPEIAQYPWSAMLSGSAAYKGEARVSGQDVSLTVSSSLVGIASALPEPFQKTAGQSMPLSFERKMLSRRNDDGNTAAASETPIRDQLTARLGGALNLKITRRERNGIFSPEFGVITIGQARAKAVRHNALNVYSERLDLDEWFDAVGTDLSKGHAAQDSPRRAPTVLRTPAMTLFGRNYDDVDATISSQGSSWKIALNSQQASGSLLWQSEGGDKLTLKLDRLAIPPSKKENAAAFADDFKTLPDMDLSIGDFTLGNYRFGRLELQADNENGFWKLNRIQINNPAARFVGNAEWRVGETENTTRLSFKLDSGNAGELLKRFDLGGVLLNGNASLEGRLQWNGSPIALDYGSLDGDMAIQAGKGQFLQVEPGIGKLLSLVNMQSLHRRVVLDFQDVFGKGFAFDTLSGRFAIQKGVMRTDSLMIDGPAARVLLRGKTDIKKETQDVSVKIMPSLGGTAAVGVAVANPLLGLVTWIADQVMQHPLDRMFSLDYKVTGTWLDPAIAKIEKASETDPPKNEADERTVP